MNPVNNFKNNFFNSTYESTFEFKIEGGTLYPPQLPSTTQFWQEMASLCAEKSAWEFLFIKPGKKMAREEVTLWASIQREIPIENLPEIPLETLRIAAQPQDSPLHVATFLEIPALVEKALEKGYKPSMSHNYWKKAALPTPLEIAFQKRNLEIFGMLLSAVQLNRSLPFKIKSLCPLKIAYEEKNEALVELLMANGYLEEWVETYRYGSLLNDAAMEGDLELVQYLYKHGYPLDSRGPEGVCPLYCAIKHKQIAVTRFLIQIGANIGRSYNAQPLIPLAILYFGYDKPFIDLILKKKIEPPEEIAFMLLKTKRYDSLQDMITDGAFDLNCSYEGAPFLNALIKTGNISLVEAAFAQGIELHTSDANAMTPLHVAVCAQSVELVERLLETGCLVQAQTKSGITPLHLAAHFSSYKIYEKLIEAGADPDVRDYAGWTPKQILLATPDRYEARRFLEGAPQLGSSPQEPPIFSHLTDFDPPQTPEEYDERVSKKVGAHLFGIGGVTQAHKRNGSSDSRETHLGGLAHEAYLLELVALQLNELRTWEHPFLTEEEIERIVEICTFTAASHLKSHDDYLELILSGMPTIVHGGYRTHSTALLFHGDKLVICDRGTGIERFPATQVFKFQRERLTKEILGGVQKTRLLDLKDYQSMIEKLRDQLKAVPVKSMCYLPRQEVSNCTWVSLEAAFWTLFSEHGNANALFPIWQLYTRLHWMRGYLHRHLSNKSPFTPDLALLQEMSDLVLKNTLDEKHPLYEMSLQVAKDFAALKEAFPKQDLRSKEEKSALTCYLHSKRSDPHYLNYYTLNKLGF